MSLLSYHTGRQPPGSDMREGWMEGNNAYTRLRPEPTVAGRAPVMSETSMASRMNFGGGAGDCFADAIE